MASDLMDDVVQLRMHHRLTARDRNDRSTKCRQLVYTPLYYFNRHGRRRMVILIAVATGQITTTHWDQMGEHRVTRGDQRPADKAELSHFLLNKFDFTHCGNCISPELESYYCEVEE